MPWFSTCRDLKGTLINGLDQCLLLFNHGVLIHILHFTPTQHHFPFVTGTEECDGLLDSQVIYEKYIFKRLVY